MASKLHSTFEVHFPENLLKALCYKTDVGPIPRGIEVRRIPPPDFRNNPNWKKIIVGCYWCGANKVDIQGICCSMKCLFIFHEWCIEVAQKLAKQKFCRLPGCDKSPKRSYPCCDKEHKDRYDSLQRYGMSNNYIDSQLKIGPKWYDREIKNSSPATKNQNTPSKTFPKKPFSQKETSTPKMDIALELRTRLIFDTDVGPIPRSFKKEEHLSSQHSSSPNWNVGIAGCYMCGKKMSDAAEYLCSKMCYSAFNEWCRQKLLNSYKFCKLPGCSMFANTGAVFCGKEHEKHFRKVNTSLVDKGPVWYQCNSTDKIPNASFPTEKKKYSSQTKPIEFKKGDLVFADILTRFLYEKSDIGPIPRKLFEKLPDSCLKTTPMNSNAIIPGCYWCCKGSQSIHGVACSDKCFFLLNEWCHAKYHKCTNKRLCKFPLCDSTPIFGKNCCKKEHTDTYHRIFTSNFSHELKSSDFALGPKWYVDTTHNYLDFYNVDEPFYEFTNFFQCTHLYLDNVSWPTTEHYFQSQKFVGTPHVEFVRTRQTPRDAFDFTRIPNVQRWIRGDWGNVKVNVMLKALEAKFTQNDDLKDLLVRTGDRKLFEHTRNDKFWGDGGDRTGQNMLGLLLMQVRFGLQSRIPYLPGTLEHFTHVDSSKRNKSKFLQHNSDNGVFCPGLKTLEDNSNSLSFTTHNGLLPTNSSLNYIRTPMNKMNCS